MQKISMPLLRICIYAQKIQRWKTLLSKITVSNFCAHTQKNFHVSIKDLRMCADNPALEDFLIQNHSHVRKKTAKSLLRPCFAYICANNPALEDSVIQNHYSKFMRM